MNILIKLAGLLLIFLGIYFLGENIYFTTWRRGIKADGAILFLTSGIFMLFLLPKDAKLLGGIAIVIGIILVFWSGNVLLIPTGLWQFLLSISSLTMGYKLFSSSRISFKKKYLKPINN